MSKRKKRVYPAPILRIDHPLHRSESEASRTISKVPFMNRRIITKRPSTFKIEAGFSLAELVIIVLILGALTFIAVPKLQFATLRRQKADTVASKIATDLRFTRQLAITNAAENISGYQLSMTGAGPYNGYDIINSETFEIVESYSIDSDISCTGGSLFKFGPLGNLLAGSGSQLTVSSEGKSFTINIVSATGMVKCTEG